MNQSFEVGEIDTRALVLDEEKPIPSPGDVATHGAPAGDIDRDGSGFAVARDIRDFHGAIIAQGCHDDPDGGVDPVCADADFPQMRERHGEADGAVNTHVEGGEVVEKNHAARAVRLVGFAEQGADHRLVPTRFVANRAAEPVVILAQASCFCRHRSTSQIRPAGDDDPCGLAFRVRIDDLKWCLAHGLHDF